LYATPDVLRGMGHVAHVGDTTNAYKILIENPQGKRPVGRPRRRWDDNI